MRFLIDESLSPRIAVMFREAELDAVHVLEMGLGGATDETIAEVALEQGRSIVSADSDFATMLALSGDAAPSLVLLRSSDRLKPTDQGALLLAHLPGLAADIDLGAVVSLSSRHVRVRRLPIARRLRHRSN